MLTTLVFVYAIPQKQPTGELLILPVSLSSDGMIYTTKVGIGKQSFNLQIDTGSANLWVYGMDCMFPKCPNKYDPSTNPKTFIKGGQPLKIGYGSGTFSGTINTEVITIGGKSIQSQFGMSTAYKSFDQELDGILGLGFSDYSQVASKSNMIPPIITISQQYNIPNIFSLYLNGKPGTSTSELIIGGINKNRFTGNITYINVPKNLVVLGQSGTRWSILFDQLIFQNSRISNNTNIQIDSGSTFSTVPKHFADILNAQFNPKYDNTSGLYIIDCKFNIPKIQIPIFFFNTVPFPISPTIHFLSNDNICVSTFMANNHNLWLLGNNFLIKYYSIFDMINNKIGFANAN